MMPTRMNVNEQKMLDSYELLMDQVYLIYHLHPTSLPHIDLTPAEMAEMSEMTGLGNWASGSMVSKG